MGRRRRNHVSISSITQSNLYLNGVASTDSSTDPLAAALSTASATVQPVSSTGTTLTGSSALFQQLSSSLQTLLLQLQGGQAFGGTTTQASNTPSSIAAATTSGTSGATTSATSGTDPTSDASATSSVNATTAATQAEPHHHHHHSGQQETGGPSQLQTDATNLLNDLTGNTSSSSSTASSTNSATPTNAADGISASFFGAFRAYAAANAQTAVPTQLGFA
jgi:hypothetical protein